MSAGAGFAAAELTKLRDAAAAAAGGDLPALLTEVAGALGTCLEAGGTVFFCGNGGSAADAQHLAAELVGRQTYDRAPAAGVALTTDTSALTAIGNDYGYEEVFARQVRALGRPGDALVGISTSGRSANVARALDAARQRGLRTVAFTGPDPRALAGADYVVAVPAGETAKIQELHIACGHIVLALVERKLFPPPG